MRCKIGLKSGNFGALHELTYGSEIRHKIKKIDVTFVKNDEVRLVLRVLFILFKIFEFFGASMRNNL